MFALAVPPGPAPTTFPGPERAPEIARPASEPRRDEGTSEQRKRDRWMLALEGVVRAPSDIGFQAGIEFPYRLRFVAGFGFMPAEWITGFIADTTRDSRARAVLDLPSYRGTIWRTQVGYRPFKKLGLYLDAGYARATIHGSFDLPPTLFGEELDEQGSYAVDSSLDIWLFETGYQWQIANRLLLAAGIGVMSTFNADTSVSASAGAPQSSEFVSGARQANDALERYGTIPFFTLRAGVDLL
ncbi:MAG TPA: hypothetical protein VFZ53_31790 [Polyangiaceae bacterium]